MKLCASLRATVSPGYGCISRALAKMNLGANDEAVAFFRRSIESNRANPLTHFFLAATLANLGNTGRGTLRGQGWLSARPRLLDWRFRNGNENAGSLLNAMRKAGVPE